MQINRITELIIESAIKIHKNIGPGLLESVYEKILSYELKNRKLLVETQVKIPLIYENIIFNECFRADIIVENNIIIEIKSIKSLEPILSKQLLTYLRLTNKNLGLLINFNQELLKDGIKRIINGIIK